MPIGRPRAPGTEEERAEARRAKVRINVQAFRKRQKEKKAAEADARARQDLDRFDQLLVPDAFEGSSVSADSHRSSPSPFRTVPEYDYADPDAWIWSLSRDLCQSAYHENFPISSQSGYDQSELPQEMLGVDTRERIANCSSWLNTAMIEVGVAGTHLVTDALLATALTVISQDRNDPDMALHGAYVQSRAIRKLRIALQEFAANKVIYCTSMLSLAALTCAMSELLATQSWTHFNNHLTGVGALLHCGGPEKLQTPTTRDHFYGYRGLQAAFSLMHGQETFLSEPEWLNPPWRADAPISQHPLHTLLDIAYQVVPDIANSRLDMTWELAVLQSRLKHLWDISSRLDRWEQTTCQTQPRTMMWQKEAEWKGLHDKALEFATLPLGTAYSMYTGVRIKIAYVMNRTIGDILAADGLADIDSTTPLLKGIAWSKSALQCLEYFHTGAPKATGYIATLFPLDAAWEYLSCIEVNVQTDVSMERDFCLATAQRLSDMKIPVFRWR